MRIRVTYSDQNETFGDSLPGEGVVGTVSKQIALTDWGDDWLLLKLDQPFTYKDREHAQMLIRSRWQGRPLGDSPTSVFILLISDPKVLEAPARSSEDFEFAAWGMAHLAKSYSEQ